MKVFDYVPHSFSVFDSSALLRHSSHPNWFPDAGYDLQLNHVALVPMCFFNLILFFLGFIKLRENGKRKNKIHLNVSLNLHVAINPSLPALNHEYTCVEIGDY